MLGVFYEINRLAQDSGRFDHKCALVPPNNFSN